MKQSLKADSKWSQVTGAYELFAGGMSMTPYRQFQRVYQLCATASRNGQAKSIHLSNPMKILSAPPWSTKCSTLFMNWLAVSSSRSLVFDAGWSCLRLDSQNNTPTPPLPLALKQAVNWKNDSNWPHIVSASASSSSRVEVIELSLASGDSVWSILHQRLLVWLELDG